MTKSCCNSADNHWKSLPGRHTQLFAGDSASHTCIAPQGACFQSNLLRLELVCFWKFPNGPKWKFPKRYLWYVPFAEWCQSVREALPLAHWRIASLRRFWDMAGIERGFVCQATLHALQQSRVWLCIWHFSKRLDRQHFNSNRL